MKTFLQFIYEENKDVKGQMSFDFEGARRERERAEREDDKAFDIATTYNRGKSRKWSNSTIKSKKKR